MKPTNYYAKIIHILQELHKDFPKYNMGRHLSTALDSYGDIWGITDKEMLYAMEKYVTELSLDIPHSDDINDILNDDLSDLSIEEEF